MAISIIAKKEFTDLINNRYLWVVLGIYAIFVFNNIIMSHDVLSVPEPEGLPPTASHVSQLIYSSFGLLRYYGAMVALVVGFVAISAEVRDHSLGVLLTKPVYRDTIVNGKFLGVIAFLFSIFCLAITLYMAGLFIVSGSAFSAIFIDYLARLPVIIIASMVYVMIFFFLSMMISIIASGRVNALVISILIILITWRVGLQNSIALTFAMPGTELFNSIQGFISSLNPEPLIMTLYPITANTTVSLGDVVFSPGLELFRLAGYMLLFMVLSYIALLRYDPS